MFSLDHCIKRSSVPLSGLESREANEDCDLKGATERALTVGANSRKKKVNEAGGNYGTGTVDRGSS